MSDIRQPSVLDNLQHLGRRLSLPLSHRVRHEELERRAGVRLKTGAIKYSKEKDWDGLLRRYKSGQTDKLKVFSVLYQINVIM